MTTEKILEDIQSLRSLINELCDLAGRLAAENAELRKKVNLRENAIRTAQRKQAEAEAERDELLPYAKEYGCDTCANEKACFVTTREGVTMSCVKCPVPDACPCSKCKDRDNWKWRGLPEAP